jgi:hypothetical protein
MEKKKQEELAQLERYVQAQLKIQQAKELERKRLLFSKRSMSMRSRRTDNRSQRSYSIVHEDSDCDSESGTGSGSRSEDNSRSVHSENSSIDENEEVGEFDVGGDDTERALQEINHRIQAERKQLALKALFDVSSTKDVISSVMANPGAEISMNDLLDVYSAIEHTSIGLVVDVESQTAANTAANAAAHGRSKRFVHESSRFGSPLRRRDSKNSVSETSSRQSHQHVHELVGQDHSPSRPARTEQGTGADEGDDSGDAVTSPTKRASGNYSGHTRPRSSSTQSKSSTYRAERLATRNSSENDRDHSDAEHAEGSDCSAEPVRPASALSHTASEHEHEHQQEREHDLSAGSPTTKHGRRNHHHSPHHQNTTRHDSGHGQSMVRHEHHHHDHGSGNNKARRGLNRESSGDRYRGSVAHLIGRLDRVQRHATRSREGHSGTGDGHDGHTTIELLETIIDACAAFEEELEVQQQFVHKLGSVTKTALKLVSSTEGFTARTTDRSTSSGHDHDQNKMDRVPTDKDLSLVSPTPVQHQHAHSTHASHSAHPSHSTHSSHAPSAGTPDRSHNTMYPAFSPLAASHAPSLQSNVSFTGRPPDPAATVTISLPKTYRLNQVEVMDTIEEVDENSPRTASGKSKRSSSKDENLVSSSLDSRDAFTSSLSTASGSGKLRLAIGRSKAFCYEDAEDAPHHLSPKSLAEGSDVPALTNGRRDADVDWGISGHVRHVGSRVADNPVEDNSAVASAQPNQEEVNELASETPQGTPNTWNSQFQTIEFEL